MKTWILVFVIGCLFYWDMGMQFVISGLNEQLLNIRMQATSRTANCMIHEDTNPTESMGWLHILERVQ